MFAEAAGTVYLVGASGFIADRSSRYFRWIAFMADYAKCVWTQGLAGREDECSVAALCRFLTDMLS
ncbi:hypothetical protein D2E65_01290 [Mycobacteroides abscessus]|nr:hypothetical protein DDJ37_08825 [Mycobacteroides abscessus]PVB20199.1 hypothetical protein DDJ40_10925 [Mycobacteroides abscessus]RIR80528.1 hypothetical protein D2E65_01290 [Mycobacteroides abscessus]